MAAAKARQFDDSALSVLFPQSAGTWKIEDLNLRALGLNAWDRSSILSIHDTQVQPIVSGDFRDVLTSGDTVMVAFIGWYINAKDEPDKQAPRMWDCSYNRTKQLRLTLGAQAYFQGLEDAVAQMSVGTKALAYVPPHRGFGKKGFPGLVPPDSHLILWVCVDNRCGNGTAQT